MRSRPDIDLKLPRSVFPGETLTVELTVTGRSVTPFDFISVDLHATNGIRNPLQNGSFEQHELFHASVKVAGKGVLEERAYHYRASFEIPSTLPPTYLGTAIEHHAWIAVRVAIPWWLDVRETFDVTIVAKPRARPAPSPVAGTSLRGNEPFVEVSLHAQSFAPGDVIEGEVAFGNLGRGAVEYLESALVGFEKFVGSGRSFGPLNVETETHRHTAFLAVSREGEGRAIPFRVVVPASAPPSLTLPRGALFWVFEARLAVQGGATAGLRTPVTIAAFEGHAHAVGAEPPRIGANRWQALWQEAGARVGLTIDRQRLRLTGELADCDVSVSVSRDDAKRSSLVARIQFRSWGLGLSVWNAGLLDLGTYFPADELGRRFRIKGRDPVQIDEALTPPLRAALLAFDEVRLVDDQVDVQTDAPGYDQPWIGEFLARVAALADALDKASRHIRPPAGMASFLSAWRRFADACDAELTVGSMAITGGDFEGAPFEIRTELEGKAPVATVVELVIEPPLESLVDVVGADAIQRLPPPIREILGSIEPLCRPLLAAVTPTPRASPPDLRSALFSLRLPVVLADPAALREVMATLLALAAALRGDRRAGPYR
jgi:hypothetical protein